MLSECGMRTERKENERQMVRRLWFLGTSSTSPHLSDVPLATPNRCARDLPVVWDWWVRSILFDTRYPFST